MAFRCRVRTSTLRGVEALPVEVEVDIGAGTSRLRDRRTARPRRAGGPRPRALGHQVERVRVPQRPRTGEPGARTAAQARHRVRPAHRARRSSPRRGRSRPRPRAAPRPSASSRSTARSDRCRACSRMRWPRSRTRPRARGPGHGPARVRRCPDLRVPSARTPARCAASPERRSLRTAQRLRHASDAAADLAEVAGQELAKRALLIAAAGGHNLLMVGPPGAGKTMLARRLAGNPARAVRRRTHRDCAGPLGRRARRAARLWPACAPFARRTTPRPSRGLSAAAVHPGRARSASHTTACCSSTSCPSSGPPRFRRCDSRWRTAGSLSFVLMDESGSPRASASSPRANPCPCGFFGDPVRGRARALRRSARATSGRIGGPLLDRIDLCVRVDRVAPGQDHLAEGGHRLANGTVAGRRGPSFRVGCGSRSVERAVAAPRSCPRARSHRSTTSALEGIARTYHLSGRGITRLLRVARTIADLEACRACRGASPARSFDVSRRGGTGMSHRFELSIDDPRYPRQLRLTRLTRPRCSTASAIRRGSCRGSR